MARVRAVLAALVGAVLLVGPSPAMASPAQSSVMQDDTLLVYRPADEVARTLDVLRGLGVDRLRVSLYWRLVAPAPTAAQKPIFDATDPAAYGAGAWQRYDTLVELAQSRGIDIEFNISPPAPTWATGNRDDRDQFHVNDPSPQLLEQFVRAAGTRYSGSYSPSQPLPQSRAEGLGALPFVGQLLGGGSAPAQQAVAPLPRVRYWSIWNEPNITMFLTPQFTTAPGVAGLVEAAPRVYRGLVDAAYAGLGASGHGGDTILVGELAPRGRSLPPLRFVRALYCVDAGSRRLTGPRAKALDCPTSGGPAAFVAQHPGLFRMTGFGHHPYQLLLPPHGSYPGPDTVAIADLGRLTRTLNTIFARYGQARKGGVPIYITEFGYQSRPPDPRGFPLTVQATYINESEFMAYSNPAVRSYAQFLLVDSARDFRTGLELIDGKPKPSFAAFRIPIFLPRPVRGGPGPLRVWGLIRPARGSRQQARIEFQRGGVGAFMQLATVTTDARGYVDTYVTVPRSGFVRIAWTDPRSGDTLFSRSAAVRIR